MTSPHPTRFIILGHGRTGSNLLGSSLNQHPDVAAHGELYHDVEEKRAASPVDDRYLRDGDDPVAFAEEVAFAPRPGTTARAAGFRLFYSHCREGEAGARFWEYLTADRGLRVVHLVRHNLLESYVSRQVAGRTGEWLRKNDGQAPPEPDPFEIQLSKCQWFFDWATEHREQARERFAGHPLLEVSYEGMVADYGGTIARVFEFLGVPPVPVTAPYRKQARRAPREQVSNFAELREAFRGTPYEWFFE
jgi:LPS sulfotransferase NodH